ncbi:type II secretion system protein C (GspC) [Paraperlucidibaca baekdonensis]|uniref:Type II secretion system protein C (GspC) n=1 Tax=Paraperlucidibaca baekdonensis TaxID=748120 RepID=A0A3E0H640_9GAMM|nr:type II secretion system protein N [Paraperlucidibaca baekdonensis]REH38668.1 type II secretion system protein C (GspC) [Paraperlucidibaca baekdonensis]
MRDRMTLIWEQRRTRPVATAVLFVASVVFAWLLGKLLWLMLSGTSADLARPDLAATLKLPPTVDARRVGLMFGEREAVAQAEVADTTLQLRLDGILENSNADLSRAFISERGKGNPEIYRPGDNIPGGASLDRIEANLVVLLRAGREEILRFDQPSENATTPTATAPNLAAVRAAQARNVLTNLAERLANSPMTALRQMGMRRTSQGYIVSITAPKQMLNRFGLKPGDRVVSINGQLVGKDVEADQKVLSQLQQSGNARVEIQRGAQTLTLEQRL